MNDMFRSSDHNDLKRSQQARLEQASVASSVRRNHQDQQKRRNRHQPGSKAMQAALSSRSAPPAPQPPQLFAKRAQSNQVSTIKSHLNQRHQLTTVPATQLDAVIIRNLIYEIGRKTILNQINLTVPEGSIYGLLGPSGCGKTTMLKCIVGRVKPTRGGSVLVFGLRPGAGVGEVPGRNVGYMPQEISIYEDFTIEETLRYFGKINRMPTSEIKLRIDFLLQFLDLPPKSRTVANLSGGQKRRVSLAAALVHSPPLLILDEPTVGVDPLLRQNIWKHLVALTKSERISVIITTHYIEEARLANVVGLMRNGRILAEDSPDQLMFANKLTNLEDVFLKLCVTDSTRRATSGGGGGGAGSSSQKFAPIASTTSDRHRSRRRHHQRHRLDEHAQSSTGPADLFTTNSSSTGKLATAINFNNEDENEDEDNNGALRPAFNSSGPTVRINTGTNQIELIHTGSGRGGRVNEAVEVFSSEDDAGADDSDYNYDDDDGDGDGQVSGKPRLAPTHDSLLSAASDSSETIDSYLALQHMHWASRRANLINLKRVNGRHLNKGPYLGLDGRKPVTRHHELEGGHAFVQWWTTLMAVTWKNYVRLRRNPPVLVFQFMLPAIQVILFCLCIGGEPFDVPVAIVNEELVPKSSLQFLNGLNRKVIRQIKYDNLSSAIEAVRRGKVWGAIHIPDKYSENLQSRLIMGEDVTNETISNGTIRVYPDLTNLHLAHTLETTFRETFINFARNSLEELGYDRSLADLPIQIGKPVYGTLRKNGYLEFMAPGVVISISYVMATGLTALAFILERRDGLLERSLVSGVQTSQILLAHAINQIFVMTIQIFLVLGCTFFIFEIPSRGPFFWVVLLILLQGCTGMGFGLLVSAICAEENTAVMMVVGTFYTNLILAGIIWPIEAMPHWLRPVSYAQPQTLPTDTLRHILSRGWTISEPGVLLGFAVTIGWLVVFLVAAGAIFKYSR